MTVLQHGRLIAEECGEEWGFKNNPGHERPFALSDLLGAEDERGYTIVLLDPTNLNPEVDPLPVERISRWKPKKAPAPKPEA